MADLAHTQRLAIWAEHGEPKAYGGSDMMREDVTATLAEVERMAEMLYRLHVAPASAASPSQAPTLVCPKCGVDRFEQACPNGNPMECPMVAKAQTAAGIQSPAAPVAVPKALTPAMQTAGFHGLGISGTECAQRYRAMLAAAPVGGEVCSTEQECEWQPWCRIHANCRRKVEAERTAKHLAASVLEAQPQPSDQGEK